MYMPTELIETHIQMDKVFSIAKNESELAKQFVLVLSIGHNIPKDIE